MTVVDVHIRPIVHPAHVEGGAQPAAANPPHNPAPRAQQGDDSMISKEGLKVLGFVLVAVVVLLLLRDTHIEFGRDTTLPKWGGLVFGGKAKAVMNRRGDEAARADAEGKCENELALREAAGWNSRIVYRGGGCTVTSAIRESGSIRDQRPSRGDFYDIRNTRM